jgi:polyhydroxyalkanoate synthesis regulator phasin
MLEFIKKSMYVGLGLATMTKDKVEAYAKELAKQTNLSEEEGRKLAEFMEKEANKARDDLKANIESMIDTTFKGFTYGKRITALEARVAALEAQLGQGPSAEPEDDQDAEAESKDQGAG